MKLVVILLSTFFALSSFACEDVNLYESSPKLNALPIPNQADVNICYSHALTTLYDLEYAPDENSRVHPFWLAYIHKVKGLHWQPQRLDYSLISLAWADLQRNGFCDNDVTAEDIDDLKRGIPYSDSQLFHLLANYFRVKDNRSHESATAFDKTVVKTLGKIKETAHFPFEREWLLADLRRILGALKEETRGLGYFAWMKKHLMRSCQERATHRPRQVLLSLRRNAETNLTLGNRVAANLRQGKALTVGYCYRIFKDPSTDFTSSPRIPKAAHLNCGAHYSLIVGSRKKTSRSCQYLVRNSYGTGFWPESSYQCWCRDPETGRGLDCHNSEAALKSLDVLGCWIDQDKLLNNTFDLSYFPTQL